MRKEYRKHIFYKASKLFENYKVRKGLNQNIIEIWINLKNGRNGFIVIDSHPQGEYFGVSLGWNSCEEIPDPPYQDERFFDYHNSALLLERNNVSLTLIIEGNSRPFDVLPFEYYINNPSELKKIITPEVAELDCSQALDEAFQLITQKGLPYLQKAGKVRGISKK